MTEDAARLREAAALMRKDAESDLFGHFYRAVADWLDIQAETVDRTRAARINIGNSAATTAALAVAAAYLGKS